MLKHNRTSQSVLAAIILFLMALLPQLGCCPPVEAAPAPIAHSCCVSRAHVRPEESSVITKDCCCKGAPIDRALSPKLVVHHSIEIDPIAAQPALITYSVSASDLFSHCDELRLDRALNFKLYLFHRALLI